MQFIGSGQTVVQMVSAANTTYLQTTSSSYVSTGLSATITPLSSSNKILVVSNTPWYFGSTNATSCRLALFRNGTTNLGYLEQRISLNNNDVRDFDGFITYLDAPATTSAITYGSYMKVQVDLGTYRYPYVNPHDNYNYSKAPCSIILLEISGY
jgi:hypothetical protein